MAHSIRNRCNTGTSSLIPDIPGLAGTPYLTNRNFFELNTLPPRMLVIGGGYIGLELGQGMARLGCQTQLLVRGDRILDREEPEVSEVLVTAFQQEGIAIHFHTTVEQVDYQDGLFQLTTNQGNALEAEALLIRPVGK